MTRQQLLQWSGIALAVSIVLSMAIRPPLRAGQPDSRVADFPGDIIADDSDAFKPPQPMTLAQLKVRLKLQEKHALNFPDGTTLEAVKKHLEEITRDKGDFPDGIPIYVNPQGLQDGDKTMESTVAMSIKGIPLGTTLALLLGQVNLIYWVNEDGLLIITSFMSEDTPHPNIDDLRFAGFESGGPSSSKPPMTLAQLKVRLKLQEKHALNFPDGTTLEAVKKHLEEITRDKGDFPDGIPIYVNPMGLADADKTMESMVEMTIKGIPLGTSLSLLLDQIGLTYWVHKDGLLIITVVESADAPPVKNNKVSPSNPLEGLRSEIRALRDEIRAHHGGGTPAGSGK